MGEGSSSPAQVETDLLPQPFRKLNPEGEDFCEEFKMKLLNQVVEKKPPEGVKYFNILLLGQAASGKSSFFNTVATAIANEELKTPFAVLPPSTSSTTVKLQTLPMVSNKTYTLPLRILDCCGLHKTTGIVTQDLESIVDGHTKPNYMFNPVEPISKNSEFYRPDPELKDKIHCLVYVAKADNPGVALTDEETKRQFEVLRTKVSKINMPQLALLNMIDRVGEESLENLFRSKSVEKVCDAAKSYFCLSKNAMLPMSCYCDPDDNKRNTVKDTLALYNLNTMLERANDYLKGELKTNAPEDFYD